jgi:archaellum biogenesis protein FlaJ (TadC family)
VDDERPERNETPKEQADRELLELLNELRVVLPSVTVLLAFLLAVPFAKGWTRVTTFQRDVFVVAFLASAVSVAFLAAPSSYHRLRFRQGEKAPAIAGIAAAAVALEAVVLLVIDFVLSRGAAIAAAAALFGVVVTLWYVLPLRAALRDRSAR